jgi:hypothetical protein
MFLKFGRPFPKGKPLLEYFGGFQPVGQPLGYLGMNSPFGRRICFILRRRYCLVLTFDNFVPQAAEPVLISVRGELPAESFQLLDRRGG